MKVKILTRIIVVANDQMVISYTQVEKEGVQQLELPMDELYEARIEFY